MSVRILDQKQVTELLPMGECIEVMDAALRTLARGDAVLPLRPVLRLPDGIGVFGIMPAWLGAPHSLGLKAINVFHGNEGTDLDSHQGLVLLFSPETGAPLAIMDASSITAIRTAAVSAVATRAMAPSGAGNLAILGSGVQARSHLEAMAAVRPLGRIRAWSPNAERLAAFAGWAGRRFGPPVETVGNAADAVQGADLVCTTTSARTPIVAAEVLTRGAHLNVVGSSIPTAREIDSATMARGALVVDRRESAEHEAGDYLIPLSEGAIGREHILGELGELLLGKFRLPGAGRDWTIFKSLGLAVEDLAAASHVLERAAARGIGIVVELGGRKQ